MSRIARSDEPLYLTKGRPFSFRMRLTDPNNGNPIILTGAVIESTLRWVGTQNTLQVGDRVDADGRFSISGTVEQTAMLPLGALAEILVTVTDTQGGVLDYVYPVEGETP